jgi:hypothetical protein
MRNIPGRSCKKRTMKGRRKTLERDGERRLKNGTRSGRGGSEDFGCRFGRRAAPRQLVCRGGTDFEPMRKGR